VSGTARLSVFVTKRTRIWSSTSMVDRVLWLVDRLLWLVGGV
jgi:hypothetical protein